MKRVYTVEQLKSRKEPWTFDELKSGEECKTCPYRSEKWNHCGTCPITTHKARAKKGDKANG